MQDLGFLAMDIVEFASLASMDPRVVEALGESGMLGIRGLPALESLRQQLLPTARMLALMPAADRRQVLKSADLGTDVSFKCPDRLVSSFATQLRFERNENEEVARSVASGSDSQVQQVAQAGRAFRELGRQLVELGLLVARICDSYIPGMELEKTILEAQTAKGRLIHYHSQLERSAALVAGKKRNARDKRTGASAAEKSIAVEALAAEGDTDASEDVRTATFAAERNRDTKQAAEKSRGTKEEVWQEWHYDYGILTLVTSPMFLGDDNQPQAAPDGHSSLLTVDNSTGEAKFIAIPEDCVLVQVGEAAQIISGGKLKATAHCVTMPVQDMQVSRETFVVFMQPSWDKILVPSALAGFDAEAGTGTCAHEQAAEARSSSGRQKMQLLDGIIPPLDSRWKEGWSFADFSKATTRQYYGSTGLQASTRSSGTA